VESRAKLAVAQSAADAKTIFQPGPCGSTKVATRWTRDTPLGSRLSRLLQAQTT